MAHEVAVKLLNETAVELGEIHRAKQFSLWRKERQHALGAALARVEPFRSFADMWMFTGDGSGVRTRPRFGDWAIDRLVEKLTPEAILTAFETEVDRNVAGYAGLSPIFGVNINAACDLDDDVRLEPEPDEVLAALLHRFPFQSEPLPKGTSMLRQPFNVTPAFERWAPGQTGASEESVTTPERPVRYAIRQRVRLACLLASTGPVELPFSVRVPDRRALFVTGEGFQSGRP